MMSGRFNTTVIGKLVPSLMLTFVLMATAPSARAAIGCTLSNPAEDLKYLYPEMTSYREELTEFSKLPQGQALYDSLKTRLGHDLDPVYETFSTPYTVYRIFKGNTQVGIVHGVNVPGSGGVIQVFVALDPKKASIQKFFFQRLESPAADVLRKKEFRAKFEGLTLADFYKHDYYLRVGPSNKDPLSKIPTPALKENARADFEASIRGLKKNLILLDFFVFSLRHEPFFERSIKP